MMKKYLRKLFWVVALKDCWATKDQKSSGLKSLHWLYIRNACASSD